jgi:hypothetical protein
MIWDSAVWKEDLSKIAQRMDGRRSQKRWSERSLMLVERDTFTAFYAIRRLMEAHKLSDNVRQSTLPLLTYPSKGRRVTYWNYHRVDELYDLQEDAAVYSHVPVLYCCNQVIHSYHFWPMMDEADGLAGVLFCSERERNQRLFRLLMDDMIGLLQAVAIDEVDEMKTRWNEARADYDLVRAVNRQDARKRSTD